MCSLVSPAGTSLYTLASTGSLFEQRKSPLSVSRLNNSIDFSTHDYQHMSREPFPGLYLVTPEDSPIERPNASVFCNNRHGKPRFKIVQVGRIISFRWVFDREETEFAYMYKADDGTNWIWHRDEGGRGLLTPASRFIRPANENNEYESNFPHLDVLI